MDSLHSAVVLSKGSTWEPKPHEAPMLLADYDAPWPVGGSAYIKFYDTTGAPITQVNATAVTAETITFKAPPAEVDVVPAGANFEIFVVDTEGNPYQIRYGKVLRREAEFFNAPPSSTVYQPLAFTDTFPTTGLKTSWERIVGTPRVYDNGGSLPNGLSAQNFLTGSACAVRWFEPLNGDGVEVNFSLLSQGGGKARVIVFGDQRLTTYLAVEFDNVADEIHFAIGSEPLEVTYQGSAIANVVADGDNHRIYYNPATDAITIYKGTSLDPLGSLPDVSTLLPIGPGYRYPALAFENNALSNGIQVSYWSAKDAA